MRVAARTAPAAPHMPADPSSLDTPAHAPVRRSLPSRLPGQNRAAENDAGIPPASLPVCRQWRHCVERGAGNGAITYKRVRWPTGGRPGEEPRLDPPADRAPGAAGAGSVRAGGTQTRSSRPRRVRCSPSSSPPMAAAATRSAPAAAPARSRSPASVRCSSVTRRSLGCGHRATSPRASRPSMMSVIVRGETCRTWLISRMDRSPPASALRSLKADSDRPCSRSAASAAVRTRCAA